MRPCDHTNNSRRNMLQHALEDMRQNVIVVLHCGHSWNFLAISCMKKDQNNKRNVTEAHRITSLRISHLAVKKKQG
jgi:hypothetical protein